MPEIQLPTSATPPLWQVGRRLALAVGIIVFVALVAYLGRDGYVDAAGDEVSLLDAFYYATVSATTTGYGDIRPESDSARLLTTVLVTPARILFLIVLVGTTVEVLAERTRTAFRVARWQRHMRDHTIICGYGVKGRSAVKTLLARGVAIEQIIVIDPSATACGEARAAGLASIQGDATRTAVLEAAHVRDARSVVVAPHDDAAAVLMTLTARELSPTATIVAGVRNEENAHLLNQGGANTVIVSSGSAGRLLGLATDSPKTVQVLEDLISVGEGLDIAEVEIGADQAGPLSAYRSGDPVIAVARGEELYRFDDPQAEQLQAGDRVVLLCRGGQQS